MSVFSVLTLLFTPSIKIYSKYSLLCKDPRNKLTYFVHDETLDVILKPFNAGILMSFSKIHDSMF